MDVKTVDLDTYRAAYRESDAFPQPRTGETIIFLHGFLGESALWQPTMHHLQAEFRCIALDLLGFGHSSKPRLKYVIDHQVDFLRQFIAAIGLDSFHLVGYSYGGWTAAAYAIAQAKLPKPQLNRLALVAPAGIRDDSFVGRYNHMRPLLWDTPLVDGVLKLLGPIASLFNQTRIYQEAVLARQSLMQQPVARSFLVDRLRPEDAIDTVEQAIGRITVPTLVVAAAQDQTIPLWHCQTYYEGIPHARLEVIPDTDHALTNTHPETIATLLCTFLSDNPAQESAPGNHASEDDLEDCTPGHLPDDDTDNTPVLQPQGRS